MKYITHDKGKILYAFEIKSNEYTLSYPGYITEAITDETIKDRVWQDLLKYPEKYVFDVTKDGQIVSIKT